MRKQLLCGVAAAAITLVVNGPVSAADLPLKAAARVAPPPACIWCGLYVGGHVAYGRSRHEYDVNGSAPVGPSLSGLALGFHAGYNWQIGERYIIGIEGDATIPSWERKLTNEQGSVTYLYRHVEALASIRGRLGMTFDRTLVYATGGLGYFRGSVCLCSSDSEYHRRLSLVGGVVGGGIEWLYRPNLSLRAEVLHYMFDAQRNIPDVNDYFKITDVTVGRIGATLHFQ